jgi:hypothetical protein
MRKRYRVSHQENSNIKTAEFKSPFENIVRYILIYGNQLIDLKMRLNFCFSVAK